MALINCTINSQALTKIGGQAIGSDNVNLVITPNQHYSVKASNFTVGSLPTGVDSITLTDTGVPGSFANTINVLVNLTDAFVMPASNTSITVDIDGSAIKGEYITREIHLTSIEPVVAGDTITLVNTGITLKTGPSGDPYSTVITGNGIIYFPGAVVELFTKTFTCATGYYYPEEPTYNITSNIESHIGLYTVEVTRTYLDDGSLNLPLQVIAFKVLYNVPEYDVIAGDLDTITFSATPAILFSPTREITNIIFDPENIPTRGGTKTFTIYGTVGAKYNFNVVDAAGNVAVTNGSHVDQTIGPKGYNAHVVTFPTTWTGSSFASVTYNVSLTLPTNQSSPVTMLNAAISTSTPQYTVQQLANVTLSLTRTDFTGATSSSPNAAAKSFTHSQVIDELTTFGEIPWAFSVTVSSPYVLKKRRDVITNDFVKTSSGDTTYDAGIVKGTITETSAQQLDFDLVYEVDTAGTADEIFNINLSNVINTPPVGANQSNVAVANNTAKSLTLAGTDADSDTITWSIVSQGAKGTATVNASTGAAVYTPTSALHTGADSFTYKLNDTYQDSSSYTIGLLIAAQGSNNPTTSSVWKWNDSTQNNTFSTLSNPNIGTVTHNGITTGSNQIQVSFQDWGITQEIVPSYVDHVGDARVSGGNAATIKYLLKYGGTTLVTTTATVIAYPNSNGVNNENWNIQSASSTNINIPSNHNSGNGLISGANYTIEHEVRWENVAQ